MSLPQYPVKESLYHGVALGIVKHGSAVGGPMKDLEGHVQFQRPITAVQFVRLVDGHLRILIAMQQQERRIGSIHVKHRAGKLGQFLHLIGRIPKQQLQCRHAHTEAVRGGLAEDTGQVAGAVVARYRLYTGGLIAVTANGAFQFLDAIAGADERGKMAAGASRIDWGFAEHMAYATLLDDGFNVRLSGQDSGRGTFFHRHSVLYNQKDGQKFIPLKHVGRESAMFTVNDTLLSEAGVLGFEFGYTLDAPETLVLWEAQFGDFANGAQVIIDQFITSSETKWQRLSGLVMLLPHGYEGQGPEHSSAKLERYLNAVAEDNIQVANCTTPANFFHLLRRQVLRRVRKPLVVMTPKSLLRHPEAVSTLDELANGAFRSVIGDDVVDAGSVDRVVLCQGKVYYDLLAEREKRSAGNVALIRVELLAPFPVDAIRAELDKYPDAELVWCQEEPKNMGAWPVFMHWFYEQLGADRIPQYVGREAAAAPATGSNKVHHAQQAKLLAEALTTRGA